MDLLNVHRCGWFEDRDLATKNTIFAVTVTTLVGIIFHGSWNSVPASAEFRGVALVFLDMVIMLRVSRLDPLTSAAADKPCCSFRNQSLYSRSWFPVTGRTSQPQGNQLQISLILPAPVNISQWKKGDCIGSGSSGKVYIASNRSGQLCAIKEVQVISNDTHSKSKEHLKQLNQEIVFLKQLSHPNIVQYRGSILNDGVLSIYMEYASKGSIHNLLKKYGPFEEYKIRYFTREILSGLAYLHGENIVHRDIKGANILVTDSYEVKLADFGLAKSIASSPEVHSSDKGTVYWMAPEVISSKQSGKGYNRSADIWSLGCTVIEMATGKPPLHHLEPVAAMFKIANDITYVPEIPDNLSDDGKNFLQLCLQRDAAHRPSAATLLDHSFILNQG